MYDVIVIGGGVTGAGTARDCAMRGLKTLLVERGSPGAQTTASSTHLIHGGLRYLLYDRLTTHTTCWDSGHIVRIAGKLLTRLPIIWPVYQGHSHGIETVETLLEVYDGFSRMKGGKPHLRLSAEETAKLCPSLKTEGLRGSVAFDEWWVDPVRLVEDNLESARRHGAEMRVGRAVTGLLRSNGAVAGVLLGSEEVQGRVVINAAGPWIDKVSFLAGIRIPLRLQKGTHLVYDRPLVGQGFLLEAASGGRYVFVVPYQDGTLVGPTDIAAGDDPDSVRTEPDEVRYWLDSVAPYFSDFPRDGFRTIVGARPILGQAGAEKLLSREYAVFDHEERDGVRGLVTIGGGKMSDFRIMAEAAANLACEKLGTRAPCRSFAETLDGEPVEKIPSFPRPWRPLKKFLRNHPRLRELHAWAYLGAAFLRHLGRVVAGTFAGSAAAGALSPGAPECRAEGFRDYYATES